MEINARVNYPIKNCLVALQGGGALFSKFPLNYEKKRKIFRNRRCIIPFERKFQAESKSQ